MSLTHFSLFTGIGGIDLAAEWAGFVTIGQCEWADYPSKVLEMHWPNIPRWRDIRSVTAEDFQRRTGRTTVDLVSGGFPCQPFSVAGKQRGNDDDRFLWPEMLRVISELKPTWVLGENVPGIVNLALDSVCADLENEGYEVQPFIIPACAVDAIHKRNRVFIVAYTNDSRTNDSRQRQGICDEKWNSSQNEPGRDEFKHGTDGNANASNSNGKSATQFRPDIGNAQGQWSKQTERSADRQHSFTRTELHTLLQTGRYQSCKPLISRDDDGFSGAMDRNKCLGNAVVPQQVYPILKAIAELSEQSQPYAQ